MFRTPRIIQVRKSSTDPIEANRGILAECGCAVNYLKAMIKAEVNYEGNELIHFVDDMVLFKGGY
eukprot:8049638-Heterocapsa_arctica.AAC.1